MPLSPVGEKLPGNNPKARTGAGPHSGAPVAGAEQSEADAQRAVVGTPRSPTAAPGSGAATLAVANGSVRGRRLSVLNRFDLSSLSSCHVILKTEDELL